MLLNGVCSFFAAILVGVCALVGTFVGAFLVGIFILSGTFVGNFG